ncbi:TetR family transcriptional regulator [Actinoplanes lobatus]|uniref:AcrR family transcriptional regulator n=1 Tax=Actinoplanes lobatus TaxID=113568 RepID=A0A7W7HGN2_9ACTN|nr:TetR/AcrR family transcriptional regulator [Actinoplanes lobatus]MBB4750207.1 AcrR family transcriptional regulator [Actinoplanes lobatus]GGN95613.1 TetR family transcriptional regulator [Actinoplanes lobatus]GIE38906.1 TetR family transcriptional regulator [Actinoplanes lobatus]
MPTGVALRDVREQLFDAADRILLRSGPEALTSRAVTLGAGCAKGVLHRHFADFDAFLAEYVLDRANRMDTETLRLREAVGTGTVTGNVAAALTSLFGSVAVAIVALVTFRDGLRARLRETWPAGVPVLTDAAVMIGDYLEDERARGRVAAGADTATLGAVLIGTAHLLFADRTGAAPTPDQIRRTVETIIPV